MHDNRVDFSAVGHRTFEMFFKRPHIAHRQVSELDTLGVEFVAIRIAPKRDKGSQRRFVRQLGAIIFRDRLTVHPPAFRTFVRQGEDGIVIVEPSIAIKPLERSSQRRRRFDRQPERTKLLATHRSRCSHVEADFRAFFPSQYFKQEVVLLHRYVVRGVGEQFARYADARQRTIGDRLLRLSNRLTGEKARNFYQCASCLPPHCRPNASYNAFQQIWHTRSNFWQPRSRTSGLCRLNLVIVNSKDTSAESHYLICWSGYTTQGELAG